MTIRSGAAALRHVAIAEWLEWAEAVWKLGLGGRSYRRSAARPLGAHCTPSDVQLTSLAR